ncbi:MAG: hypothetical protein OXT49_09185 [Gammaproteobacteria bacterium]|nr:hypothetical protein [Gammaproteobacteria bacterium]
MTLSLSDLLTAYKLTLKPIREGNPIPASFWGESEAGIIGNSVYQRPDTPLHSVLHESCHYICMDSQRRYALDTDAGGTYEEENAVCYLQILLAGLIEGYSSTQMCKDMDDWGYTFRLGSAQAWFEADADDAKAFLELHNLVGPNNIVCVGKLRS